MDEDALLGIGSDDEFSFEPAQRPTNVSRDERGLLEEEDMIQLGVDDGDDLDE